MIKIVFYEKVRIVQLINYSRFAIWQMIYIAQCETKNEENNKSEIGNLLRRQKRICIMSFYCTTLIMSQLTHDTLSFFVGTTTTAYLSILQKVLSIFLISYD